MNQLRCKPCLAFEALASLVFCNYCRDDIPAIKDWVRETFDGIQIGPSDAFFRPLVAHHSFQELEGFGVADLVRVYPTYIQEDAYIKQYEAELIKGLKILEASDFGALWRCELLPILNRQCVEAVAGCGGTQAILADVARVRQEATVGDVHVFVTYFTHPASFQLTPNSFITNAAIGRPIDTKYFLRLFAHELCHGFSNRAAREAYRELCARDRYMRRANWFLNEFCARPGDEEEFVQALEHAIAVKNGLETYDEALGSFVDWYECSVPLAIVLFDELHKLTDLPADVNAWLCQRLAVANLKNGEIQTRVDAIIPEYSARFEAIWQEAYQKDSAQFAAYEQGID